MIGRGDGDGVDFFVFEKLADVDVGLGFGAAQFFDVGEALVQNIFVDVAERGDFDVPGTLGKPWM